MPNPRARHRTATSDPKRRFCVQCGERNYEHEREDKARCYDCAGTPVPARFCPRTGVRIDPPPPERRPLLSSYMSVVSGIGMAMPPHLEGAPLCGDIFSTIAVNGSLIRS